MPNPVTPSQILLFVGLLMVALELILGVQTGFDLVVLGSILLLGGASGIISSSFPLGLVICVILTIVYFLFGRGLIRRKIIIITKKTNIDKLVGGRGVVIRSITPDTAGLVRVEDEDWRAVSEDVLYEKDRIEVLGVSGVTLKVKKYVS